MKSNYIRLMRFTRLVMFVMSVAISLNVANAQNLENAPVYLNNTSSWALNELKKADEALLIPDYMKQKAFRFSSDISRSNFSKAVVLFYDQLGGSQELPTTNPFQDTWDPVIIKAYHAGIIKGKAVGLFKPEEALSRQEMCVMIIRALNAVGTTSYHPQSGFQKNYEDSMLIASWALEAVESLNAHHIFNGTSETFLSPLEALTAEQAIVLLYRAFDAFSLGGLKADTYLQELQQAMLNTFIEEPFSIDFIDTQYGEIIMNMHSSGSGMLQVGLTSKARNYLGQTLNLIEFHDGEYFHTVVPALKKVEKYRSSVSDLNLFNFASLKLREQTQTSQEKIYTFEDLGEGGVSDLVAFYEYGIDRESNRFVTFSTFYKDGVDGNEVDGYRRTFRLSNLRKSTVDIFSIPKDYEHIIYESHYDGEHAPIWWESSE